MAGRAERRARRLLAAYPWRVRAEQGGEIVGTALDALPPGAGRLPWRDQVDLVRGGLRMRRQRRPPWPTVLAYSLGSRIDATWIRWVFDDLEHPHYVRNKRLRLLVAWLLVMGPLALAFRDPLVLLYGSGGFVGGMVGIERERRRRRERHGLLPGGSDPGLVWVRGRRGPLAPNVAVAPFALALGLPIGLGGMAWAWAVVDQRPRTPTLGASSHAPAPPDVLSALRPWAAVGVLLTVLLAALVLQRAPDAEAAAVRAGRVPKIVATALGGSLALAAGAVALTLRWQWNGWRYAYLAALLVPLGLALVVAGVVAAVRGRRRGAPLGIWDLAPVLAPRRRGYPVARWVAEQTPGLEPWSPEADRRTGRGHPSG